MSYADVVLEGKPAAHTSNIKNFKSFNCWSFTPGENVLEVPSDLPAIHTELWEKFQQQHEVYAQVLEYWAT